MKGLNVKKLAAIGIGAALVGSALAPIAYAAMNNAGSIEKSDVVDSSGNPVVNVVVGTSGAAVGDFVWAGNIAAKVAQLATKDTTVTVSGGTGGQTPIASKTVDLEVGGTTSVSGGKTFFSYINSYVSATEANFKDQNVTNSNIPSLKYTGNKAYTWGGTSYTTTMQEKINFSVDVKYDPVTKKDLVATISSSGIKYAVDLGSGIPMYEGSTGTTKFSDDANDNIRIPFFADEYLVKTVDYASSPRYIELVKAAAEKTYAEGDEITGLVGKDGNEYKIVVGAGGTVSGSTKVLLGLYDAQGNLVDDDYFADGDVIFYGSEGTEVLETSVNIQTILKQVVADSEIYKPTILIGTDRLLLKDAKGYPYDVTKQDDEYDWISNITWDTTNNKVTKVSIDNTSRYDFVGSDALTMGDTVTFPNDVATLKFVGLELPGVAGATKTERTTPIEIGNGVVKFRDSTYEADHEVPMYLMESMSDSGFIIETIDGKSFYIKLNMTDANILACTTASCSSIADDANSGTCIGDGNFINGQKFNIGQRELEGDADVNQDGFFYNRTWYTPGDTLDINGMQLTLTGVQSDANCVFLESDGNVTIRKDSSTGTLLYELFYADENISDASAIAGNRSIFVDPAHVLATDTNGTIAESPLSLAGQSDVETQYVFMVDEIDSSTARFWLFLDDQNFGSGGSDSYWMTTDTLQYSKQLALIGTDNNEDLQIDYGFYIPNDVYLPTDLNGTDNYNQYYYRIAQFRLDEDGEGSFVPDVNVLVDAASGVNDLPTFPNANLSNYAVEVVYDANELGQIGWKMSTSTTGVYPDTGYTDFGSKISIKSGQVFTAVIPENQPQAEILVSGEGTTTELTGAEELADLAEGDTGATTGGTNVKVKAINVEAGTCTIDDATPVPAVASQVVPVGQLVYPDTPEPAGAHVIVGGFLVNKLVTSSTALSDGTTLGEALAGAGDYVVDLLDNGDIVVAGYSASDTVDAAKKLIDALDAMIA